MRALVAGRLRSDNRAVENQSRDSYRPADYWSARLSSDFTARGTGHICYSEAYNRWLYRAKGRALRRGLRGVPRPAQALDIGSGAGWVVDRLMAWGADTEGCDVADVAVERLRAERPGVTFFVADWGASPLPRPDGAFDLVTLLDVAYHVVDDDQWAAGVADIARLLRPGGRLIVTDGFGGADVDPAPHVRFRSRARWDDVARGHGLVPTAVTPYVRWLSRSPDAWGFGWMSDGIRGAVEYVLEMVAPRPAHLRCATFVRQR